MKKTVKTFLMIFLSAAILTTSVSVQKARAYTPPYTNLRVGLYYGGNALPSANLQNVTGFGTGYQFGTLDANRQFIPLGAATSETKITVLRDKNMVYDSSKNCYNAGLTGDIVVGCFHIQLSTAYSTFAAAQAALAGRQDGFVKYSGGSFYGCIGNYTSADDATAAISSGKLTGASVNSGTSSTITVVKTGTKTILFEFENGSTSYLVIMPTSGGGEKCQTWFKGYRYNGAFQYMRVSGGDITIISVVNIEDYSKGVVPYEMIPSWPVEALKVEAVCARTYAVANLKKHGDFDVCATDDCQVYQGVGLSNTNTDAARRPDGRAVPDVQREAVRDSELFIEWTAAQRRAARMFGWKPSRISEASPILMRRISPQLHRVTAGPFTYTSAELTARLRSRNYNCGNIVSMAVTQYTDAGNVFKVTLVDSDGVTWSLKKGDTIRYALGVNSIRFSINGGSDAGGTYVNSGSTPISGGLSSYFAVGQSGIPALLGQNNVYAITGTGETVAVGSGGTQPSQPSTPGVFTLKGTGNGHNVGMSQWGCVFHGKIPQHEI